MNRLIGSLLCCGAFALAAADGAPSALQEEYAVVQRLQLTEPALEGSGAIWRPNADFYDKTDDLRADWRAVSPAGREIPARLLRLEDPVFSANYELCPSRITASGRLSGTAPRQIWELELSAQASELSAVELKIDNRTFEKLLTVEIAGSEGDWHLAVDKYPLIGAPDRKFSDGFRVYFQQRGTGQKVRLILEDVANEPNPLPAEELKVDAIRLFRRVPEPVDSMARRQSETLELLQHTVRNHRTALTFEARRLPLTGFELTTGSRNFTRSFSLHGSQDLKGWHTVLEGTLRANAAGLGELGFDFEQSRYRYYLLEIDNDNAAELTDIKVTWYSPVYLLLFSEALPALHLYYDGDTGRPEYPEHNFSVEEILNLPVYQALPPEVNPQYRPFITQERPHPGTVYLLLASVSVVVGALLLLAMRHLKQHPKE